MAKKAPKPENLAQLVFLVRGEKVILDADLAKKDEAEFNRMIQRLAYED